MDCRVYLVYPGDTSRRFDLRVKDHGLVINHIHLVVTPQQETSVPDVLKRTNQLYA